MDDVEPVKEVVLSSPKRARGSDVVVGDDFRGEVGEDVVGPFSKKLYVEEAALAATPNTVFEFDDLELRNDENDVTCSSDESCVLNNSDKVGCMSGEEHIEEELKLSELDMHSLFPGEQHPAASECSILGKEDAARVLRSLEEELGVSSESDDYTSSLSNMASSSTAQEALFEAALSSWGEEIWSSNGFNSGQVSVAIGCSSGSSLIGGENESAAGCQGFDELRTLRSAFETADGAQVNIGFLSEASDDELGIPPSPNTDRRELDLEKERAVKEVCEESMSALSEVAALVAGDHHPSIDTTGQDAKSQLHGTVSWALQEKTDEYPDQFEDIAAEEDTDWLMPLGSNLDFLLDFSTGDVPITT